MSPSGPVVDPDRAVPELIPARMVNEFAYCPRLAYLEWVQGEFADNAFTEDGRHVHRRVDAEQGHVEPSDDDRPQVARSVMLSSTSEGFISRIDLVEASGALAVPIDYKRGKKPEIAEGAYEPERVQLCVQGLVLRDNGFTCDHGVIYFAGSRERTQVVFDDALVARTRELGRTLRAVASQNEIPAPLVDSPKCNDCSLAPICLPDEVVYLRDIVTQHEAEEPRRLVPARDDALPLYVQAQGGYVSKSGEVLAVKVKGEKVAEARLFETSQVNLMGNIQVSTQVLQELCGRGIPVCYFSAGGWFYGMTSSLMHKNVELRLHQFRAATDEQRSLALARRFVGTKIKNCRTMLRRNASEADGEVLRRLKDLVATSAEAESLASLLGIEGTAARLYFESFPRLLKRTDAVPAFSFEGRNRRPPKDPVNAMLSLGYAMLTKDLTITSNAVGLDPFLGFYHQPRYGRPSLALDLVEEFRPLIVDSTVIGVINNGIIGVDDFVSLGGGVSLKPHARKAFIEAYERRMDQLVTHPVFGYQVSYRRVLEVQTRLLARHLAGEIDSFPEFATR